MPRLNPLHSSPLLIPSSAYVPSKTPSSGSFSDYLRRELQGFFGVFLVSELMVPDVSPMTVRFALAELASQGFLFRLARGIYYKAPLAGELDKGGLHTLLPSPVEVAETVARKRNLKIVPCMEHCCFLTGLDKSLAKPYTWLCNATTAKLKLFDGPQLEFIHCKEARMFTFESDRIRNLSNAIRYLGLNRIGDHEEKLIKEQLQVVTPEELRKDILKCPEFVRGLLMELKK